VVSLICANWRAYSWRQLELSQDFHSLPTQNIYIEKLAGKIKYIFFKLFLFNLYFNLRKTRMCLETLFIKFSTCLFHFVSSVTVIPKCLWSRLEERRTRRKLHLLYNIQNGCTPSYLLDLIPPTIQSTTIYPLKW
jgi:hypothetical protein